MKTILILCAGFSGATYAGSRDLGPSESLAALSNWERLCESGRVPEGGSLVKLDGVETWVYCKKSRNNKVIEKDDRKTFNVEAVPQAVFLKPGDLQLKQKVTVTGNVKAPKTRIYYIPPSVDTNVDVSVNANTEAPNKPSVFFLSKDDGGSSGKKSSSRHGSDDDDSF